LLVFSASLFSLSSCFLQRPLSGPFLCRTAQIDSCCFVLLLDGWARQEQKRQPDRLHSCPRQPTDKDRSISTESHGSIKRSFIYSFKPGGEKRDRLRDVRNGQVGPRTAPSALESCHNSQSRNFNDDRLTQRLKPAALEIRIRSCVSFSKAPAQSSFTEALRLLSV